MFCIAFYTPSTKPPNFKQVFESLTQAHTPEQLYINNLGREKPEISHHFVIDSHICWRQSSQI